MYHVSAQGIDERMINVHYYYKGKTKSIVADWHVLVESTSNC